MLHFASSSYGHFLRRAGFEPIADGPILALTYDGDASEVAAGAERVRQEATRWRGVALPPEAAAREWAERFFALRLKRAGPSVLGAESWLPLDQLAEYEAGVAAPGRAAGTPDGDLRHRGRARPGDRHVALPVRRDARPCHISWP